MARFRRSTKRYVRRRRRPSGNPIKRYVGKRRNIKYGNIYRDVKMLKGLINTEVKYIDASKNNGVDGYWDIIASPTVGVPNPETPTPPTQGYVRFMVDYPTQGDDYNNREGRSLKLKSLQLKGVIRVPGTDSSKRGQCRVMIIVDHQAQSGEDTDPVPIMFQLDQNGDYSMSSRINRQQNKRYSVLAVKKLSFSQNYFSHSLNIFKRLSDKIKFNGTGPQDFMDKAFHVVVLADARFPDAGTGDITANFLAQFETRFTYIDN